MADKSVYFLSLVCLEGTEDDWMTREEEVTDERWSNGLEVDEVERRGVIDGEEAMVDG